MVIPFYFDRLVLLSAVGCKGVAYLAEVSSTFVVAKTREGLVKPDSR